MNPGITAVVVKTFSFKQLSHAVIKKVDELQSPIYKTIYRLGD